MTQITMSEKTMQPENENQTTQTVDQSDNSDSNCNKIFLNWICCKAQEGEEADSLPPKQPIGSTYIYFRQSKSEYHSILPVHLRIAPTINLNFFRFCKISYIQ